MTGYISPATKILRYPGVLCAMQHGERVWPLHVEMDLAGVCNAHCQHCRFGDRQDGALMGRGDAERLLDELAEGGTLAVTFSGGGEPTCNAHFTEIVTYARLAGLRVGVYSNGILGDRLVSIAGVASWIYVSLDADNAADYRAIKGIDGFEQACETVRRLVEPATLEYGAEWTIDSSARSKALAAKLWQPHRAHPAVVGVGFLLTGANWQRAERMREVGLSLGADYVQFRPVAELPGYEWIPAALAELERIGAMYSPERFRNLYDAWRGVYRRGYEICRASDIAPCIGADGTLWACPNTRGLPGRDIGNVVRDGFGAVWAGRGVQRVGSDCEPTCRHHSLNKTLEMVCENQPHEEFV